MANLSVYAVWCFHPDCGLPSAGCACPAVSDGDHQEAGAEGSAEAPGTEAVHLRQPG